eukprot:8314139-Alexandrium_andersonii.AAC.1
MELLRGEIPISSHYPTLVSPPSDELRERGEPLAHARAESTAGDAIDGDHVDLLAIARIDGDCSNPPSQHDREISQLEPPAPTRLLDQHRNSSRSSSTCALDCTLEVRSVAFSRSPSRVPRDLD